MIDKRVIAVIVIFILGGLFIYSFANPLNESEEKPTENGGIVTPNEKDPNNKEENPTVVNKESLEGIKSQLESLNKDDYTEESWELIQNLIRGAENSTSQEEFDLILSQIDLGTLTQKPTENPVQTTNPNGGGSSSISRPNSPNTGTSKPSGDGSNTSKPKPVEIDKTALNNIKAQLAKLNKDDYTTESWNLVQAQIKIADLQTTQAGFNEAVKQINLGLLQKKPTEQPKPVQIDKTALNDIKNKLAGYNKNDYTEASWNAIQNQIAVAEKQTTQDAFDREVAKIDLNSLQVRPIDKTKLNAIKNQLAQLKQNNYTPSSWQAIQDQIAIADAQPTQKKFDEEVSKINLNTLQLRTTATQIGVSLDKMGDSANIQVVKVNDNYFRYTGQMNTNVLTVDGTTIRDFVVIRITSPDALSQVEKNNIQMVYEGETIGASEFMVDVNNHSYVEIYQPFSRANDGSGSKDNLTTVSFTVNWGYGETTQYTITIDVEVN